MTSALTDIANTKREFESIATDAAAVASNIRQACEKANAVMAEITARYEQEDA